MPVFAGMAATQELAHDLENSRNAAVMTAQTRVAAGVFATGVAAAVTKEPRLGLHRADVEPIAEDIPGRARATSTVPAVVPQH